jgi:hypothetical protein
MFTMFEAIWAEMTIQSNGLLSVLHLIALEAMKDADRNR